MHMQRSCFAHSNYHVFDSLSVWLGSKLSAKWSARAMKPPGDCGGSNNKPVLFFSRFGGSFARSFLAPPLARA